MSIPHVSLARVADIQIGPFGSLLHKSDYVENGVPVINPMHISPHGIAPDQSFSVPKAKAVELKRYLLKSGEVIMGRRGEMGRCAVVTDHHEGMICGTGSMKIIPSPHELDPTYLVHILRTPKARKELEAAASGVTMLNLNASSLSALKIPLPPLEEQKRIAGILDQADALRRLRARALDSLAELTNSIILTSLLENKEQTEKVIFSDLAEKTRNSFCNGPFGSDLLTSEIIDAGVPVVYIKDIASGRYVRKSNAHVTHSKAKQLSACSVSAGDLLIAKVGTPPCSAAIYPEGEPPAIVTQDVIRVRVNTSIASPEFVAAFLNSEVGRNTIHPIVVQATRARVSLKDLKGLQLYLPKLSVQKSISQRLNCVSSRRRSMLRQLELNNSLFTSLQHRAFRGEL